MNEQAAAPKRRPMPEAEADGKRNMGIGLSVCMSIVQSHGGTMTARNRPEGGAAFRFTLPMEEPAHEDQR